MKLTLTKQRIAKNGMVSYKADNQRSTGTIYFDKKMFNGEAPQTLTVDGDNLAEPVAKAAPAQPAAASASTPQEAGAQVS